MKSVVCWFEIPAVNFERCVKFYENILATKMHVHNLGGIHHAFFDHEDEAIGGAIVQEEGLEPSDKGPLVYLNGGDNLQDILDRIEAAGGLIKVPKTLISPDIGYLAKFLDTEGNLLALFEPVKK